MKEQKKAVLWYVGLVYTLSYTLALGYYLSGGKWGSPGSYLVAVIYMFMPLLAAFIVTRYISGEPVLPSIGVRLNVNRWYLAAWLTPPVLAVATMGVSLLFPGVVFTPGLEGFYERLKDVLAPEQLNLLKEQARSLPLHPFWLGLLQGLFAGVTINAVAAFGEEAGWRGLMQKKLAHLGFWPASAIIGVVWGLWHMPLIIQGHNYPQHPYIGVMFMVAWTILLSPLLGYVRIKARSVFAAAIGHGTLNAVYGLAILTIAGGSDLLVGMAGLAGFIVLAAANVILYLAVGKGPVFDD